MSRDDKILERHFAAWRTAGLITPDQEAAMRRASTGVKQSRSGRLVLTALGVLAGALSLAGLTLIVAENWDALPRGVKLGGWAMIQVALLTGAYRFGTAGPIAVAEGLALAASGWVLAGIALVSQIYQLSARAPNGVWLWLVLLVPTAWVLPRGAVTVMTHAAVLAAFGLEAAEPGSWVEARKPDGPWLWVGLPLLAAAVTSVLPRRVPARQTWTGVWVFGVLSVALLVLGAAGELDSSDLGGAWWIAGAGLVAALLMPGVCLPAAWSAGTARALLVVGLVPWIVRGLGPADGRIETLSIGLAWICQFAIAILVIRAGAQSGASAWVNLGYLALFAGVVTRYFDFFGDFLQGGAALLFSGLLLLGLLYALHLARRRTLSGEGEA